MLPEQIDGGDHPWSRLYDPSRTMIHGLREYLAENLDAAQHWSAHLGSGDIESPAQLKPGQGGGDRQGRRRGGREIRATGGHAAARIRRVTSRSPPATGSPQSARNAVPTLVSSAIPASS